MRPACVSSSDSSSRAAFWARRLKLAHHGVSKPKKQPTRAGEPAEKNMPGQSPQGSAVRRGGQDRDLRRVRGKHSFCRKARMGETRAARNAKAQDGKEIARDIKRGPDPYATSVRAEAFFYRLSDWRRSFPITNSWGERGRAAQALPENTFAVAAGADGGMEAAPRRRGLRAKRIQRPKPCFERD